MFSIGEFARHGRVSVRMLRHYDARSPEPISGRYAGFLGPNRCLVVARMRLRSELSRTKATSVITVTATGEEKPRIRTTSWTIAAQMAQIITVPAAQASPR